VTCCGCMLVKTVVLHSVA